MALHLYFYRYHLHLRMIIDARGRHAGLRYKTALIEYFVSGRIFMIVLLFKWCYLTLHYCQLSIIKQHENNVLLYIAINSLTTHLLVMTLPPL